jgi:S-adenosyl-L-methionine hydrolase (adenosine-forming)
MKSRQSAAVHPVTAFPRAPVITLLTDFGTADYFVAAMKGVILSRNPQACITDITHEIPPQDIEAGAFILLTACSFFPPGTIHVAVIDPGVGSSRKPILIEAGGQFFVGPDNGLFSYVCDRLPATRIFHLTNGKYFLEPVSQTFNGRDIFAPVAAALSTGIKPQELGTEITDYVRLKSLAPETSRNSEINARVIHIDRFGNCVTNITRIELSPEQINAGATLRIKGKTIKSFRNYFNEKTASRDKIFAVWGSAGFLEIAAANQSAAKLLNIQRGDSVIVR